MNPLKASAPLIAVMGALLGGCAAAYVEPTSGPIATLTVPPDRKEMFSAADKSLFSSREFQIALKGEDGCGTFMKMPEPKDSEPVRIKLIGGRDYFLMLFASTDMGTCLITSAFSVEEGKQYEASFGVGDGGCIAQIVEGAARTPVPLRPAKRDEITGSSACER